MMKTSALLSVLFLLGSIAHARNLPAECGPTVGTPPGVAGPVVIKDPSQLARKTKASYKTVPMSPAMAQADAQSHKTDFYMTASEREQRRFVIISGHTYFSNGRSLEQTANASNDQMNYVMDAAGNFYLFDENTCHVIRHGSIFDGQPVAGAGDIQIEHGQIVSINSKSGHYFSKPLFMSQVIPVLNSLGTNPPL